MAQNVGIDVNKFIGNYVPIIFRANLTDPASFFGAQYFPMQDKDIIYISNAHAVQLQKFVRVVNSVAALPVTAAAINHGFQ